MGGQGGGEEKRRRDMNRDMSAKITGELKQLLCVQIEESWVSIKYKIKTRAKSCDCVVFL